MLYYYERNTLESFRNCLESELHAPGWRGTSIAEGLLTAGDDIMPIIIDNYNDFTVQMKQAIVLSLLYMKRDSLWSLDNYLSKFLELARADPDEFVRTTANVLIDYPNTQTIDLNIDNWSDDFNSLIKHIGEQIVQHGVNFHPMEDMLLHPNAHITPSNVSPTYDSYRPTSSQHFKLTTDSQDLISTDEERDSIFRDLIECEEAEEQAAQAAAQKKAQAELRRRIVSPTARNDPIYSNRDDDHCFQRRSISSTYAQASSSSTAAPGADALYTKRPARPTPSGGHLFVGKKKLAQMTGPDAPRGFQKFSKTRMLDFREAEQFEKNVAAEVKKAKQGSRKRKN